MSEAVNALDYLAKVKSHPIAGVCVAFGDDPFLKRQVVGRLRREVLGDEDGEFSLTVFDGRTAELRDVMEELATMAMFGGGRRLVVVEDADEGVSRRRAKPEEQQKEGEEEDAKSSFVSRHRTELEDYVARPSPSGVLVLLVKSLPSNTRLYKAVVAGGLAVDCNAPKKLTPWLTTWAEKAHHVTLAPGAADLLVELVEPELGLLDQELAKLALSVGPDGRITPETVAQMVGTWRSKTAWVMLDAALDGNVREALVQLDRLLLAGEVPIAILGQISASLRRFAAATRLILQSEAAGRRPDLRGALEQSGVKSFVLQRAQSQLRQLGRHRGAQLYRWLLETDLALKGASALPPRLVLESLVIRIAAPEAKDLGRR
ncbi:MAG: DNA polymerase III subunit delta [Planctomycetia bacterium]|nr:DNA polymerase III subunit delta [Planctomycetia bacterium]